jgi:hypothetical protein
MLSLISILGIGSRLRGNDVLKLRAKLYKVGGYLLNRNCFIAAVSVLAALAYPSQGSFP